MKLKGQSLTSQRFLTSNPHNRLLALSVMFSIILVMIRIIHTDRLEFVGLIWNIFLAWIPLFFSQWMTNQSGWCGTKKSFVICLMIWLLFIPNSFYIVTDLFHLIDESDPQVVPIWFDLLLIFSFSWNGLMLGILSTRQMEKLFAAHFPNVRDLYFIFPVMLLNGLGVYVGRYLRYNSWDVLINPFQLSRDVMEILLHPWSFRNAWGMIFCFSALMTLIYLTLKKIAAPVSAFR